MSGLRRSWHETPITDIGIGALLMVGAAVTALQYAWSFRTALDLAASVLTAGVVSLRRRAPTVMVVGFSMGLLVLAAVGQGATAMWAFIALLIVGFSVGEQLARRSAACAFLGLLLAGIAYDSARDTDGVATSVLSPLVIIGLPFAAGLLVRRARQQSAQLAQLASELAEQRDRAHEAAALAERTRIAREMHDVIAHIVGVMVVHAGAAERLLADDHPAHDSVHAIRATGKEAMNELRRVVGLLRVADVGTVGPQPGLESLPELVRSAQKRGPVDAQIDAQGLIVCPGAGLTVYRTVQEGLTNAARYAPGAPIRIAVRCEQEQLVVSVDDDGQGDRPEGGSGFGLVGLAERAEIYGGRFEAGPRADGHGWRVRLALPLAAVRATSGDVTTSAVTA